MIFAICDDNKDVCRAIETYVANYFMKKDLAIPAIYTYYSGQDITRSDLKYDIVFMDVEMPEMNGIEACHMLAEANPHTLFVMITSHDQYIDDAFRLHAFRFLTKPIDWDRFDHCLQEAVYISNTYNTKINIVHKDGTATLYTDEIIAVEPSHKKSIIHTVLGIYKSPMDMNYWETQLNFAGFYVPSRGFVINFEHVKRIDKERQVVIMEGGIEVCISRRKSKDFKNSYLTYLNSVT